MRIVCWGSLVLAAAGLVSNVRGQTPQFTCIANAGVPPTVRAEGFTELIADLILNCTGGTPTPAGRPVPQLNVTVSLSANVTSAPSGPGQFSEALLLIDEPASAANPSRPLLNCGNTGAPDNGNAGSGVCAIVSTGNPASSYDGTQNGYGTAACDGASGRPSPNSYGCGRPNAFQGQLGTPQNPGQLNAITFYNVPIDPPGTAVARTIRITNIRANASSIEVTNAYVSTYIQATVSIVGQSAPSVANAVQIVAFVFAGLVSNSGTCQPSAPSRVRVCEGFAASWRSKNFGMAIGNGAVSGNATAAIDSFIGCTTAELTIRRMQRRTFQAESTTRKAPSNGRTTDPTDRLP